jgi:hypothetical protein
VLYLLSYRSTYRDGSKTLAELPLTDKDPVNIGPARKLSNEFSTQKITVHHLFSLALLITSFSDASNGGVGILVAPIHPLAVNTSL